MISTPGFVGARLVQARKARGLSAIALSEMINVKSATISQYEHGKHSPPPEVLDAITDPMCWVHIRVTWPAGSGNTFTGCNDSGPVRPPCAAFTGFGLAGTEKRFDV